MVDAVAVLLNAGCLCCFSGALYRAFVRLCFRFERSASGHAQHINKDQVASDMFCTLRTRSLTSRTENERIAVTSGHRYGSSKQPRESDHFL